MNDVISKVKNHLIWVVTVLALGLNTSVVAQTPPGRYVVASVSMGTTVYDTMTKLTWRQQVFGPVADLTSANSYCASLPTEQQMSWRVPTVKELLTLVDYSLSAPPMIDSSAFPGTPSGQFVSLTVEGGAPTVWAVDFGTGRVNNSGSSAADSVRCVFP
jgi:hypothetical protein